MGGSTLDMTKGSPWKLITQFAVPVFLSQVFQQLYNTADALIVGRFLGDEALAAVLYDILDTPVSPELLPAEDIVYFGDTARVPYGSKTKETVLRYSRQIVRFLQKQGVKAIVIACNTASALALDTLEKEIDIPIIGVVKPGAKVAARETTKKRVGVIATEATINSHLYKELIQQIDPEITVIGKPCPLFVPLVEEGWRKDPVTEIVARRYLKEMQDEKVDTLILGCTHYPLLRGVIGSIMGDQVQLVNPAYETSLALKQLLTEKDLLNQGSVEEEFPYRFYVSDAAEKFKNFANSILPYDVEMTKQVNLEE